MRDPSGRETRGVVAEVTPSQVTLVSMTGTRTRLSPTSFGLTWLFTQAAPRTGLGCARRSCPETAVFRTRKDALDEYVCPRHLPVGLQAELLTDVPEGLVANRSHIEVICPSCASPDPTEDHALPRPERAPWSWWTCHLCSRAWVTISAPPEDVVGPQARGRWYQAQILSAVDVANTLGSVERIEAGRGAYGDVSGVPNTDPAKFQTSSVRLILEIEPANIHLVLNARPTRLARERAHMGVQRLGGRPNRPSVEQAPGSNVVPIRPRVTAPVSRPRVAEPPPIQESAPPPPPSRDELTRQLVPIGSQWRRISTSETVIVDEHFKREDGTDMIAVHKIGDRLPSMHAVSLFVTAFVPSSSDVAEEERLFTEIRVNDEWRGVDGVEVVVQSKQDKRRTVTVALPSGSTRTLAMSDFRDMRRIVRRTAYERLRAVPLEKKE